MFSPNGTSWSRRALVAALTLAFALSVAPAFAAPAEPTLSVDQLQTLIDASPDGVVHGYLKTVVKGSTVVEIPVEVSAVTAGFSDGPADMSSLILFEATGPVIDKIGGIAAGMSGSPIFVDDNGTDKLVGALSYGDWFTLGGTGLATPIDAMTAIENDVVIETGVRELAAPVMTDGGLKDRVIVSDDPAALSAESADGAFVAKPLSEIFVGGLNPKSRIYAAFAKAAEKRGVTLAPIASGLSSRVSTYNAEFEGGSAIAALASRGDLWVGGVGTVTYANNGTVVAFGHPAFWEGISSLYMCNAWVDGIWPSSITPYKLARPAAVRGTIIRDRSAGILGVDGDMTDETPVTARALNLDTGQIGVSNTNLTRHVANSANWDFEGIAPMAAYLAGTRVTDASMVSGSAVTTTTVVVSDGTDTYTIVRSNLWDSEYDVPWALVNDVNDIVGSLQGVNNNGIAHADILSVDLDSQLTSERRLAEIVGLDVPGGLKSGDNTVTVSMLYYGEPDTQTVNVKLNIPAGVPTTGELMVSGPGGYYDYSDEDEMAWMDEFFYSDMSSSWMDRRTVKNVVDDLRKSEKNDVMHIEFAPEDIIDPMLLEEGIVEPKEYDSITTTLSTGYYLTGGASKTATKLEAEAYPTVVSYGGTTYVGGSLLGTEGGDKITVYGTPVGGTTETVLAVGTVMPEDTYFEIPVRNLKQNMNLRISFDGDEYYLPSSAISRVYVTAKVTLKTTSTSVRRGTAITLTASVAPTSTPGSVVFERFDGRTWRAVATKTLASGTATYRYAPPLGVNKYRARYVPGTGATNKAGTSNLITVTVRL